MHFLKLSWCSFTMQGGVRRTTATCLLMLFSSAATAANHDGINGSRSLETDMAPLYEKLLSEIQINLVRKLPPASGTVQQSAQALCPDMRTRMAQLKGSNQKLITLDERLCERTEGNRCVGANVWRARSYLREQLVATCGLKD